MFGIIILLLGVSVTPSFGISNNDDTTPPVTTHTLDPPEPDGLNGWYISDVNVTLSAIDISGINATYYRIKSGEWEIYNSPFVISEDENDILIEYYSVDNVGNIEEIKSFMVDIDQTEPEINLWWEIIGGDKLTGWHILFTADAWDECSRMNRVEYYLNGFLQENITGPGPYYWELHWPFLYCIIGLISNRKITKEYVSFYGIIVRIVVYSTSISIDAEAYDNAGNMDYRYTYSGHPEPPKRGIYFSKNLTYPNNYFGYIGRFFIFAFFDISNIDWKSSFDLRDSMEMKYER